MNEDELFNVSKELFVKQINPFDSPQSIASRADACINAADIFMKVYEKYHWVSDNDEFYDYEEMRKENEWK